MKQLAEGALLLLALVALTACGDPEPRYGEASITEAAPRVSQSGTTFGQAAALELAPGCPGYLDAEQPGHLIRVEGDLPFTIQVRSQDGPTALAVATDDEVRCDSDEGSGHVPSLSFQGAGEYQVFVAALRAPAELSYELNAFAEGAAPAVVAAGPNDVSVTITSNPPGADVVGPDDEVVGQTPAMFMLSVAPEEMGQTRAYRLRLEGHDPAEVSGTLGAGAMVLHAQLSHQGATDIDVTSEESVPLRDYQNAALAVDVGEQCTITEATVEVEVQHSFVGDLRVVLEPPWDAPITLLRHQGGARRNLDRTFTGSDLSELNGHETRGRWTLRVHDDAGSDEGSLERFRLQLHCGVPGEAVAVVETPPPRGRSPRTPRPNVRPAVRPNPRTPRMPDLPTRAEIVRVLGGLRGAAASCATQGGQVRVMATVQGNTGRVTSVSSSGTASSAERSCVQRVVRRGRFARFRRQSVDVDYTYDLPQPRSAGPANPQVLSPWN